MEYDISSLHLAVISYNFRTEMENELFDKMKLSLYVSDTLPKPIYGADCK